MRRTVEPFVAALLLVACGGGKSIPTDRSLIITPEHAWLTLDGGELRFQHYSDKNSQWFVLGTRLKFKTGGYLAHRATGEPQDEVYMSAGPDADCGWEFEALGADELEEIREVGSGRQFARIRATGGRSAGGYLATGAEMKGHSGGIGQYALPDYRVVLVADRSLATIFEVRQYRQRYFK